MSKVEEEEEDTAVVYLPFTEEENRQFTLLAKICRERPKHAVKWQMMQGMETNTKQSFCPTEDRYIPLETRLLSVHSDNWANQRLMKDLLALYKKEPKGILNEAHKKNKETFLELVEKCEFADKSDEWFTMRPMFQCLRRGITSSGATRIFFIHATVFKFPARKVKLIEAWNDLFDEKPSIRNFTAEQTKRMNEGNTYEDEVRAMMLYIFPSLILAETGFRVRGDYGSSSDNIGKFQLGDGTFIRAVFEYKVTKKPRSGVGYYALQCMVHMYVQDVKTCFLCLWRCHKKTKEQQLQVFVLRWSPTLWEAMKHYFFLFRNQHFDDMMRNHFSLQAILKEYNTTWRPLSAKGFKKDYKGPLPEFALMR